jgi:hypothetical protein
MKLSVLNIEIPRKTRAGCSDLVNVCLAVSAFRAGVAFLIHCLICFSIGFQNIYMFEFSSQNAIVILLPQNPFLVVLHFLKRYKLSTPTDRWCYGNHQQPTFQRHPSFPGLSEVQMIFS